MSEEDYRAKLKSWSKSRHVIGGMKDIDKLLAELDQEKEQAKETKKAAVQGRLGLRVRLKNLISLFYHKTYVREKRNV